MMDRFALCLHDERRPEYIEHEIATLVGQRVFGMALGYEDLNDHDELRHDPMMAILAGKLTARREDCAPVAGKSTLNRLELSKLAPTRYHKISHNPGCATVAIGRERGRPEKGNLFGLELPLGRPLTRSNSRYKRYRAQARVSISLNTVAAISRSVESVIS
jgi:hypothetical protein